MRGLRRNSAIVACLAKRVLTPALLFGLAAFVTTTSVAQNFSANLANIPGQTALQERVGAGIAATCANLAANPGLRPAASVAEDLFFRCREMVQNANGLATALGFGTPALPSGFSLGMTSAQLNGVLNDIAHDEAAAQGANSTQNSDIQVENLSGRLSALRGGAGGISTAGLSIRDSSGQIVSTGVAAGDEDDTVSKLGLFITGDYSFGEDDGSAEESGYEFDGFGLTGGLDYQVNDNFIAGVAVGYSQTDNDFDQDNGELNQDTYSLSAYGSVYSGSLYFDGVIGYAFSDLDIDRNIVYPTIVRNAAGETDGEEFSASGAVGYDISKGAWSFGPFARLSFVDTDLDAYSETGAAGLNLSVADQNIQSLESTIGSDVSYSHSTSFGVVIPQIRLEWAHEFDDDSRQISARYTNDPAAIPIFIRTDSPDRTYFNLGGGLSALFASGKTAFAEVETVLGREDYEKYTFKIGARFEL